jgi:hypothetical protein
VPVVRVAPACSSASTTLASHAFMLVLRAVKEREMWLSGCRTGGEDVACTCPLPCRAGETLYSSNSSKVIHPAVSDCGAAEAARSIRSFTRCP